MKHFKRVTLVFALGLTTIFGFSQGFADIGGEGGGSCHASYSPGGPDVYVCDGRTYIFSTETDFGGCAGPNTGCEGSYPN
ncbi:MAG TPA: hypothetical protein DEQ87_17630 [Algoriphagus sp.]|mgnify:CR=1 FL=1|jgi:hypothetical protein|uniref:hypothetical protein n=1 Tax=unclassified Algoriphagus TaxID=2641541 RepID=UPI000C505A7C|nr:MULTISPECIES: hypothetical protein [unclassified Algoriphagus]MAL12929.1 hypothetical protein [Algoriphagus sp.]MAN86324.1 hypothetical protein [Algoriphagus sp.]QYH39199.1 hypothetical protein GYM62_10485 [Algoriphagus sp. NBT04N3]HAD52613.1 hypothetical protein [Algoriphagus sp.]HAS58266.1 hypothetical protein [Algoriphagus sp.]|tara:strand:+ start:75 stop:314 length:240 start_codon:yes stop_codon:yes gene_type:complete